MARLPPSFATLGAKIGHATLKTKKTGCSVILFDRPAVCSVHVAGGAPGTRDTDMLDPSCTVDRVNALLLAGGSAFGLAAADGVMQWLADRNTGFPVGADRIPIVPAAVIYDRNVGGRHAPGPKDGRRACDNAAYENAGSGAIGAGCGASVGKFARGLRPSPGGLGVAMQEIAGGALVAAIMAVNALGNVVDPRTGAVIAGATDKNGNKVPFGQKPFGALMGANTTIGAVITNASLSKAHAKRVAMAAHDGLARSIVPSHTPFDGDTVFAASTGTKKADLALLCAVAAEVAAQAVLNAVRR